MGHIGLQGTRAPSRIHAPQACVGDAASVERLVREVRVRVRARVRVGIGIRVRARARARVRVRVRRLVREVDLDGRIGRRDRLG